MKPPPYQSPLAGARVRAERKSGIGRTAKRVIRQKSWHERIASIPSTVLFELALFPHNVPLPPPDTTARLLGGALHIIHFSVRLSQMRAVPEEELSWEDLYDESRGSRWFDWKTPLTIFLISVSLINTLNFFTRIKLYNLHLRNDPVSSPNAAFISTELDFSPLEPPPLTMRFLTWLSDTFSSSWRFLLNFKPPPPPRSAKTHRVQQLSVWIPGELERKLFTLYSPVHSFLWIATNWSNWILMLSIMAITSAQLHLLTDKYEALVKDKQIIAEEVMHEYDVRFVNPRINPIRKDAAVMTHESEVVNIYE
ncbi:hypothetical protein BD410DRAFT_422718 [Rickenella mellea]|uniref:Nuclear rim protein 1 n=1 Tax=Rickenella mellea TaxID=50990 RepID=A0A4Y7QKQ1_9AGAM|nr:hypothetical protein BD410DRAFT_422718 [Rickenella mellea]